MRLQPSELYPATSLGDARLAARALKITHRMLEKPGAPFNDAFDLITDVKAAYEFVDNERLSLSKLLAAPLAGLRRLIEAEQSDRENPFLAVQDTTEVNLSGLNDCQGLGPIGNPANRGYFLHPTILVSPGTHTPLGVLGAATWARSEETRGKAKHRHKTPFEEKESVRWWDSIVQAENVVASPGRLVHVGDREIDIYEVMSRAQTEQFRLLIRLAHDRSVKTKPDIEKAANGRTDEVTRLYEAVDRLPLGELHQTIDIEAKKETKKRPAQPARTAEVRVRWGKVTIQAPRGSKGSVELSIVNVFEENPPDGCEPVDWLLATGDNIETEEQAWRRVQWYRCRWLIEEIFKALKHELRVEARQFEQRDRHEIYIALALQVAVMLVGLKMLSRCAPELDANEVLSPDAIKVLVSLESKGKKDTSRAKNSVTLQRAVYLIARLGGYLGRKNDGPPGTTTLSRGLRELCARVEGFRLARASLREDSILRE